MYECFNELFQLYATQFMVGPLFTKQQQSNMFLDAGFCYQFFQTESFKVSHNCWNFNTQKRSKKLIHVNSQWPDDAMYS